LNATSDLDAGGAVESLIRALRNKGPTRDGQKQIESAKEDSWYKSLIIAASKRISGQDFGNDFVK
jgi:hypothetical protein